MDFDNPREVETHKGVLALATEAFKYLALANGGAAVALLSKLNLEASTSPSFPFRALEPFAFGLMACGSAVVAMFIGEMLALYVPPEPLKKRRFLPTAACHLAACIFMSVSTVCFGVGCGYAIGYFDAASR